MRIKDILGEDQWNQLLEDEELEEILDPVWAKLDQDREDATHGRTPKKTSADKMKRDLAQVDTEIKQGLGLSSDSVVQK